MNVVVQAMDSLPGLSMLGSLLTGLEEACSAAGRCKFLCTKIRMLVADHYPIFCDLLRYQDFYPDHNPDMNAHLFTVIQQCVQELEKSMLAVYYFILARKWCLYNPCSRKSAIRLETVLQQRFEILELACNGLCRAISHAVFRYVQHAHVANEAVNSPMIVAQGQLGLEQAAQNAAALHPGARANNLPTRAELLRTISEYETSKKTVKQAAMLALKSTRSMGRRLRLRPGKVTGYEAFAMSLAPNGRYLAVSLSDEVLCTVDIVTGQAVAPEVSVHGARVNSDSDKVVHRWGSVAWSPDGTKLAAAYAEIAERDSSGLLTATELSKQPVVWEFCSQTRMFLHKKVLGADYGERHNSAIKALAWRSDGRYLATACDDKDTILWDVAGGRVFSRLIAPDVECFGLRAVAWRPENLLNNNAGQEAAHHAQHLSVGSYGGNVYLWDVSSLSPDSHHLLQTLAGNPYGGTHSAVECIAWHPMGSLLAAGHADGSIVIWDPDRGTRIANLQQQELAVRTRGVNSLSWSPCGAQLLAGFQGPDEHTGHSRAAIWTWKEAGVLWEWELERNGPSDFECGIVSTVWSPVGNSVVLLGFNGDLRLCRLRDNELDSL